VGLLLLIACANVANLLLARAAAREREVAIRRAVGAGRGRLVRQLFTESVLLALVGAGVGLVVSRWAVTALVALISSGEDPVALDLAVNGRVLAFTILVSLLTAVLFGLIPALRGTRVRPHAAMSLGGRGVVQGHARFGLGKALVSAQVALSLTLLVGAGLLVGSLRNLLTVDPGFRADPVLVAYVDLSRAGLSREQQPEAQRLLLERVRGTPGVRAASTSALTPISGSSWNDLVVADGFEPASEMDALSWFNEVSDGYFATLGTRLLAGRDFDRTDVAGADRTAIVNDAFVRKFFRGAPALGRQFRTQRGDGTSDPYTVVGVVENAKYVDLRDDAAPTAYLPASQAELGSPIVALEVRGDDAASSLAPAVKQALLSLHPTASIEFTPLVEQMAASLRRERLLATLSAVFGSVALLLSVLGLYGVTAYSVARRRNEIGIRMALGASGARVRRMVLGDVARIVALGVVVGTAGALLAGKLVRGFLYGLTAGDPRVLVGAAAVLVGVALAAGLVPAWRASRVDALAALREQ
jgi:predicted permease